jgi:hypothetical protein
LHMLCGLFECVGSDRDRDQFVQPPVPWPAQNPFSERLRWEAKAWNRKMNHNRVTIDWRFC